MSERDRSQGFGFVYFDLSRLSELLAMVKAGDKTGTPVPVLGDQRISFPKDAGVRKPKNPLN